MRQQWIARWEEDREKRSQVFISITNEFTARIAFQIERIRENQPVPEKFILERMGEPFSAGEP